MSIKIGDMAIVDYPEDEKLNKRIGMVVCQWRGHLDCSEVIFDKYIDGFYTRGSVDNSIPFRNSRLVPIAPIEETGQVIKITKRIFTLTNKNKIIYCKSIGDNDVKTGDNISVKGFYYKTLFVVK